MDDVATGDAQQHIGVGRDHQFTTGDDRLGNDHSAALTALGVVVLPPPLLAGDVDDAVVVLLVEGEHLAHGGHADCRKDDGRENRQRDLQLRISMRLLGDVLAAILELPHRVADHREHDDADHTGYVEHRPLEVVDAAGIGASRIERVLRCILGAARQEQSEGGRSSDTTTTRGFDEHGVEASRRSPSNATFAARRSYHFNANERPSTGSLVGHRQLRRCGRQGTLT